MAKVYPQSRPSSFSSSSSSNHTMTSRRETFTIWMKSLVFHGHGCTVFDSSGQLVYRVDNYEKIRSGNEVCLMDPQGKVLFSIRRKGLGLFGHWDGYKWSTGANMYKERCPWFQVRRNYNIFGRGMTCHVTLGLGVDRTEASSYRIVGFAGKLALKITDTHGGLLAEVRQKQLSSGVVLGDDVLSLVVEPQIDHSLVMALVIVYGLMTDKI